MENKDKIEVNESIEITKKAATRIKAILEAEKNRIMIMINC